MESEDVKLLWDVNIQCDNVIEARRADLVLVEKEEQTAIIVDISVPVDANLADKDKGKVQK